MGKHQVEGDGTFSDYLRVIPRSWQRSHADPSAKTGPNEVRLQKLIKSGVIDEVFDFEEAELGPVLDGVALVARNFPYAFDGNPLKLYLSASHEADLDSVYFDPNSDGKPSLFVSRELFDQTSPDVPLDHLQMRDAIVGSVLEHIQLQLPPEAMRWVWSEATNGRVAVESLSDATVGYASLAGVSARVGKRGTRMFGLGIDLMCNALLDPSISEPTAKRFLTAMRALLGPEYSRRRGPYQNLEDLRLNTVSQGIAKHGFNGVESSGRPSAGQRLYVQTQAGLFRIEEREVLDLNASQLEARRVRRLIPRLGAWEAAVGGQLLVTNSEQVDKTAIKRLVVIESNGENDALLNPIVEEFERALDRIDREAEVARDLRFSKLPPSERDAVERIAAARKPNSLDSWGMA